MFSIFVAYSRYLTAQNNTETKLSYDVVDVFYYYYYNKYTAQLRLLVISMQEAGDISQSHCFAGCYSNRCRHFRLCYLSFYSFFVIDVMFLVLSFVFILRAQSSVIIIREYTLLMYGV